jgi:hypothetical protein
MDAAGMRSTETSAAARSGRRELMGRNPVSPGATGPSRNPVMAVAMDPDRNLVMAVAMDPDRNPVMAVAMDPDRNPATPGGMGPSRPLSTKSRDTTRRRPPCTDRLITDRDSMVRAGVGDDGGGKDLFRRCESGAGPLLRSTAETAKLPRLTHKNEPIVIDCDCNG